MIKKQLRIRQAFLSSGHFKRQTQNGLSPTCNRVAYNKISQMQGNMFSLILQNGFLSLRILNTVRAHSDRHEWREREHQKLPREKLECIHTHGLSRREWHEGSQEHHGNRQVCEKKLRKSSRGACSTLCLSS